MDKEAMTERVERHIDEIMRKEHLTYWDYLTLKAEIARIETAETEVKRQAEAAKSHKQYLATMASLGLNVGGYNG